MKFRLLACLSALAMTAGLSACGSSDSSGSSGGSEELTVWVMKDSVTDSYLDRFAADFEKRHSGTVLDIQIQEWEGISQKITSALASNDAPDVIEVGNTQVAQYAESGGVRDLTGKVGELKGEDWLPGLAEPGRTDGKQYGIPWYAANRVVVYNKDLFEKADIDAAAIKTRDQWTEASAKLNSGGTQGIYLPGQSWHVLAGFIWDEGGDLAVRSGGTWKGSLHTPEALRGMDFYRELQSHGKGPKDADEAEPPQAEVMGEGNVAQMISAPGVARAAVESNPELEGKLGFFPIPGKSADKPGTVFLGGSDLVIPETSAHPDLAYQVVKALAGDKWQTELATTMSYVPNRASLSGALKGTEGAKEMAEAAPGGRATPNSPQWTAVEANNPIKAYQTRVLTGGDAKSAAKEASESIGKTLNAKSS
ncbi:extracellular solute-binding protein [Streptomyces sp. N2-109]|uniref:Extracellular solute-binding protein n=1 Tax=Streptomyces gossypii TaxID=2883101 RepID=A0ABT2K123_9ACTN|nr:extracellular solute-binding protein [Streptomyces gossypii]MCT2593865.1 extracellular solute-binding protein [Streptomyces gossypii]